MLMLTPTSGRANDRPGARQLHPPAYNLKKQVVSNYEEGSCFRPEYDALDNMIVRLIDEARIESRHLVYETAVADYKANSQRLKLPGSG